MATAELALLIRPASRGRVVARRALPRPLAQSVLLGLLDAVRLLLSAGSQALARSALIEPSAT